MKKALVILFDKVEEIEAVAPIDILRRGKIDVTTASLEADIEIIGRSGIAIDCDELLEDVIESSFDAVILPGGPGVYDILEMHPRDVEPLEKIIKRHFERGKIVAAICAAPAVLDDFKLLSGKNFTAHTSVAETLKNCDASRDVVRDGNLITSRGAGTAIAFGLEILAALTDAQTADDVAKAICFKR